MKKLLLVLSALALAGCAHTSTKVSEPIACSTDCTARYENIKAMATKFLGYSITHETPNSFSAQIVDSSKSNNVTSAMNVFRTPDQIFVDVDTSAVTDTTLVSNIYLYTKDRDFTKMSVHKTQSVVVPETYTDQLFW